MSHVMVTAGALDVAWVPCASPVGADVVFALPQAVRATAARMPVAEVAMRRVGRAVGWNMCFSFVNRQELQRLSLSLRHPVPGPPTPR